MISQLEEYTRKLQQKEHCNAEDAIIADLCQRVVKLAKPKFEKPRCYSCKLHNSRDEFYSTMCEKCGDLNRAKKEYTADLHGKIAIVTGGRIKIGYYTALKLLRCGATVIITTRFAIDAIKRYEILPDYCEWKSRLKIIQVDFLSLNSVNEFITYVQDNYSCINYLINNAAQTLSRPREFYRNIETPSVKLLEYYKHNHDDLVIYTEPILPETNTELEKYFPIDKFDEHGQLLDKRKENSWSKTIETAELTELTDVITINSIIPYYLIQKLIPLFTDKTDAYIINASSMEGKFNRKKSEFHPHTNMAKASLNMITRTIGEKLKKKYGIIVLSVDTGWNTIEEPNSYDQKSPLDCEDGMARLLDPIFNNFKQSGVFLKDFLKTNW